jgi:hypothetical protein
MPPVVRFLTLRQACSIAARMTTALDFSAV